MVSRDPATKVHQICTCGLLLLTAYRHVSVYHTSEPAETAEPIEMLFGLRTRVGPGNHVLYGGPDIPEGANMWGKGRPVVEYRDTVQSSVQKRLNRLRCRLGCGLGWAQGIMCKIGSRFPWEGYFWGKGAPIVKYRDFLP